MADYMHLDQRAAAEQRARALEPVAPKMVEIVPVRTYLGPVQKIRLVLGFSPAPEKVPTWTPPA